ncbi:hypothetical protein CVT26_002762 [Gymnopilus dilepis]|uniref:Protein CMS1 n=1 Tax=Gymnopilus dilepis TaxID=231916 RepID=A0A409VCA5_9AGAR|nr:hypothetical protein CVT26_002762 [Gymnopilus dilepis]
MNHAGDDLEDDFVLDDTVALSGDEDTEPVVTRLDDEDVFVDPGSEDDGQGGEDEDDAEDWNGINGSPPNTTVADKKRKRREKEKERKAKVRDERKACGWRSNVPYNQKRKLAEAAEDLQGSIAEQSPRELSDYLHSVQTKSFPNHSSIELEDIRIPGAFYLSLLWKCKLKLTIQTESSIADTTQWTGPRNLDHLVDFISKTLPTLRLRLGQRSKSNGAPTLLYVAGAALRVADVCRVLKTKQLRGDKGGEVAKLFAKHFKLSQHVTYLKQTKIGAAVGTPGRLGKLLNETDALNISALSHIILDITHKDSKNRNLLEIPETRDEIFQTVLKNEGILKGIKEGKIQVVLF